MFSYGRMVEWGSCPRVVVGNSVLDFRKGYRCVIARLSLIPATGRMGASSYTMGRH